VRRLLTLVLVAYLRAALVLGILVALLAAGEG
jgi:hypothetical protein